MIKSKHPLEQELFKTIEDKTPDYIKNHPAIDIDNQEEITFTLKKEHLADYDATTNPEGLGLKKWFANYAKEARVSTAGIRGNQNILYPWDTRFPINFVGIMIATLAKALVANETKKDKELEKIAAGEVRYNTQKYVDIIARIQANQGIKTHVPVNKKTIPIWLASFLAFKLDLLGGEYVTSSHGISVKTATKDLNGEGSQYLPEESLLFVNKMQAIFDTVERDGSYAITIAPTNHPLIDQSVMAKMDDGVDLYIEYLQNGIASDVNLSLINDLSNKIIIENVGGSAYTTLSRLLKKLNIDNNFEWFNVEEDPFFHGIGKIKLENGDFYDYSVDAAIVKRSSDGVKMPVIETMGYDTKLKNKSTGTVILITDPDHDRLSLAQIEDCSKKQKLDAIGIDYITLEDGRLLSVYTPNQAFLMIMDFHMRQLKKSGQWANHPRFIIKTTASTPAWDEWAAANGVKSVNTPVGFKELASIMKKCEKQLSQQTNVIVKDIFNEEVNLGVEPRLVFAGEESGGMIIGSEKPIQSNAGRLAIAMREKSATEAIIIGSALVCELEKQNMSLADNLEKVFESNKIKARYDIREDISYYNESEPDIDKLKQAKEAGEALRTKNDIFYLTLALAERENIITLEQVKEIFSATFKELDFSDLQTIKFVGDGTYLEFSDKFIEIRPSGTDAKTKAYGGGLNKAECVTFARALGNYSGEMSDLYKELISEEFYQNAKELSLKIYQDWSEDS